MGIKVLLKVVIRFNPINTYTNLDSGNTNQNNRIK